MHHLVSGLEDDTAPSLDVRVGLCGDFKDLSLELLLCGKEAVPEVVADGALLEEVLERGLVLTEADDPGDVGHGAADEGGLEEGLGSGRVGHLEVGEVDIALGVLGEVGLEDLAYDRRLNVSGASY